MKESMLFVSLLLMALLLPMNSHAQNNDFGMWFSVGAVKKINKQFNFSFETEYRLRDNLRKTDRWSFGVEGGYKITNWLKASAGYTLLYDNNEKNTYYDDPEEDVDEDTGEPYGYYGKVKKAAKYWGARHRFNISLTGEWKYNRFTFSIRERWQYTYRPEKSIIRDYFIYDTNGNLTSIEKETDKDGNFKNKIYKGKGKNVLRSRFEMEYDFPQSKINPYLSVEVYNSWSVNKIRFTTFGANWKITKSHIVDLCYRFQYVKGDDEIDDDPNMHVIGLGYKYKF